MTKIYIYKVTVDDGGAPCVSNGILSLAICKPAIRSSGKRGDNILGFAANHLYKDNSLVYMAKVTNTLQGRDYFSKAIYSARPDCIYEWDGGRFSGRVAQNSIHLLNWNTTWAKRPDTSGLTCYLARGQRVFGILVRTVQSTTSKTTLVSNHWLKKWAKDTESTSTQNCEENSRNS
jgi:hypothetical protein